MKDRKVIDKFQMREREREIERGLFPYLKIDKLDTRHSQTKTSRIKSYQNNTLEFFYVYERDSLFNQRVRTITKFLELHLCNVFLCHKLFGNWFDFNI